MNIIPAILPLTYEAFTSKAQEYLTFAPLIQLDLCDGKAGSQTTWMPPFGEALLSAHAKKFQYDLMLTNPELMLTPLLEDEAMQPHSIVVHVDGWPESEMFRLAERCQKAGVGCGLSISNTDDEAVRAAFVTSVGSVFALHPHVFVQVMGIRNVGAQGQDFDQLSLTFLEELRSAHPTLLLQVDGAMRPETALMVKAVGVQRIVVGSYLANTTDSRGAYDSLSLV